MSTLAPSEQVHLGFADTMRSEWVKLRSLRSTYWSMLAAAVCIVGLGVVFAFAYAGQYKSQSPAQQAQFDPTTITLSGVWFAQLAIGVLGILTITAEHASGTIRSSLAAVPRRGRLLAAKAAVFGGVTLATCLPAGLAAFLIGQPILARSAPHASLADPGVLRAVAGAGLYLTGLAVFCVAIGIFIRHTAGAVATMVAVLFAVPTILSSLPDAWQHAARWLPSNAGGSLWIVHRTPDALPPWLGFGAFLGYTAVLLLGAYALFARRDV
jgi:ABC-2 type transport system permease protein